MIVTVDGVDAHASTGGVELVGNDPVVVLIHGAGMNSTVWQLQTRYLAHRGVSAVAVDLPGHGFSEGEPLPSIDAMADWIAEFAGAAGFDRTHVVGHSMGTFVALELASRRAELVASITLCATATSMPVHPELMEAAHHDLPRAAALMAAWGHARAAHVGPNPTPGLWMTGATQALVENGRPGVLAADFKACVAYDRAEVAAGDVACPATVVIGRADKMTPAKGGRSIAAALAHANVVELDATGHQMMTENPRAIQQAILTTLKPQ